MSDSELACVYSILMLVDDDISVTADKINSILKAANINFVESYLPGLFASALGGKNVKDILMTLGTAASSAPVSSAPVDKAEPVHEVKPPVVEESESDEPMGLDLFG